MFLFLLGSFPLYLYLVIRVTSGSKAKLVRVVRYFSWGVLAYIPVYIFSRLIPNSNFFPWDIFQVFWQQLVTAREAYFRIASVAILSFIVLRRCGLNGGGGIWGLPKTIKLQQIAIHSDELLCWFSGYFLARNFHDFLLLGPAATVKSLFFLPLSRLLFAQFSVFALEFMQLIRHPDSSIRQHAFSYVLFYFLLAFVMLNIFSSTAIILNAYWGFSLIMLILLLLYFCYVYQLSATKRRSLGFGRQL